MFKSRNFQVRRGRNNRVFYKTLNKGIFDYETSDGEVNPHNFQRNQIDDQCFRDLLGKKRSLPKGFRLDKKIDKALAQQKEFIGDMKQDQLRKNLVQHPFSTLFKSEFQKKNQRPNFNDNYTSSRKALAKRVLTFDFIRVGGIKTATGKGYVPSMFSQTGIDKQLDQYRPSTTHASSSYIDYPKYHNDPVIDYQFKKLNFDSVKFINSMVSDRTLGKQGYKPNQIYEEDVIPSKRFAQFDELLNDVTQAESLLNEGSLQSKYQQMNLYDQINGGHLQHPAN
mmetsp:Transcript_7048/g.11865  ORF Transcript_7048/g.11865 Transcript_7048/m.11865 type:complete len:281 (-) Transcript_7048:293-1135(-)